MTFTLMALTAVILQGDLYVFDHVIGFTDRQAGAGRGDFDIVHRFHDVGHIDDDTAGIDGRPGGTATDIPAGTGTACIVS